MQEKINFILVIPNLSSVDYALYGVFPYCLKNKKLKNTWWKQKAAGCCAEPVGVSSDVKEKAVLAFEALHKGSPFFNMQKVELLCYH